MKIGIIRRNGLGDLLCVMPLVYLCKERFPGSKITLIVDPRGAPLLPYLEGIDDSVVISNSFNKYLALIKTAWRLRDERFDLLISARPTPMKLLNFFLYALRAKDRMGYVDGAWHGSWVNQPREFIPHEERHQMVKCLRLIDHSFEAVPLHLRPRIKVSPKYFFNQKTLLVSVSNNRVGSQLESEKIARLLNKVAKSVKIIINCEPKDRLKAEALAKDLLMETEVIATGSFDDFVSLIASVDTLFIGDGGIMHLAAALDKPQVILFGGTKIWEWAPLSDRAICLGDRYNVNSIPEEQIEKALEKIL